jgi:hypothetical protein
VEPGAALTRLSQARPLGRVGLALDLLALLAALLGRRLLHGRHGGDGSNGRHRPAPCGEARPSGTRGAAEPERFRARADGRADRGAAR